MITLPMEEKAAAAKRLLEDPVLLEAIESAKNEAFNAIVNSAPEDTVMREQLYFELRAVDSVRNQLQSIVNDIKLAAVKRRS